MSDFWENMKIPMQTEDDGFQFVNPVVMAQRFITAIADSAEVHGKLEVLSEQIANLEVAKARKERDLRKLRRELFANSYHKITKSAGTEIQEAFLLNAAKAHGKYEELVALEEEIETLTKQIEARKPRVEIYKNQLKALVTHMEWGKQYLDFDKLLRRAEMR